MCHVVARSNKSARDELDLIDTVLLMACPWHHSWGRRKINPSSVQMFGYDLLKKKKAV